jgi:hypothetical protein
MTFNRPLLNSAVYPEACVLFFDEPGFKQVPILTANIDREQEKAGAKSFWHMINLLGRRRRELRRRRRRRLLLLLEVLVVLAVLVVCPPRSSTAASSSGSFGSFLSVVMRSCGVSPRGIHIILGT